VIDTLLYLRFWSLYDFFPRRALEHVSILTGLSLPDPLSDMDEGLARFCIRANVFLFSRSGFTFFFSFYVLSPLLYVLAPFNLYFCRLLDPLTVLLEPFSSFARQFPACIHRPLCCPSRLPLIFPRFIRIPLKFFDAWPQFFWPRIVRTVLAPLHPQFLTFPSPSFPSLAHPVFPLCCAHTALLVILPLFWAVVYSLLNHCFPTRCVGIFLFLFIIFPSSPR